MVALVKDPVIEIAREIKIYRIKELSEDKKREFCERANKTFNGKKSSNSLQSCMKTI